MKLLTKEIIKSLPDLHAQDGKKDEAIAYVKFFCPWDNWRWFATEYDNDTQVFYGLVFGHVTETGYFELSELQNVTHIGLKIERDMSFLPKTLKGHKC